MPDLRTRCVHVSRCPRLRVCLPVDGAQPVEVDCVFSVVALDQATRASLGTTDPRPFGPKELANCCVDDASRAALAGPLFLDVVRSRLSAVGMGCDAFKPRDAFELPQCDDAWRQVLPFATAVEVVVRYLAARRLKGNSFAMLRTFHVVDLLSRIVQRAGVKLGPRSVAGGATATAADAGASRLTQPGTTSALDSALDKAAARLARSLSSTHAGSASPAPPRATVELLVAAIARAGSRMHERGWGALVGDAVEPQWLPHVAAAMGDLHSACKAMTQSTAASGRGSGRCFHNRWCSSIIF